MAYRDAVRLPAQGLTALRNATVSIAAYASLVGATGQYCSRILRLTWMKNDGRKISTCTATASLVSDAAARCTVGAAARARIGAHPEPAQQGACAQRHNHRHQPALPVHALAPQPQREPVRRPCCGIGQPEQVSRHDQRVAPRVGFTPHHGQGREALRRKNIPGQQRIGGGQRPVLRNHRRQGTGEKGTLPFSL